MEDLQFFLDAAMPGEDKDAITRLVVAISRLHDDDHD